MTKERVQDRLKILAEYRDDLWRAELGAWLHNLGKLHKQFAVKMSLAKPKTNLYDYRYVLGRLAIVAIPAPKDLPKSFQSVMDRARHSEKTFGHPLLQKALREQRITLPEPFADRADYAVADLIELQESEWYTKPAWLRYLPGCETSRLTELMETSHEQASGGEKRSSEREEQESAGASLSGRLQLQGQKSLPWSGSSVFGFEREVDCDACDQNLNEIESKIGGWLIAAKAERMSIRDELRHLLSVAIADSQRPINDVYVSHMGEMAAAFFKAALAGYLITGNVPVNKTLKESTKWRLYRLAVDGPEYYGQALRAPDLLIRRALLKKLLNRTAEFLEDELCLCHEIYRDEYGSAFILPELEGDHGGEALRAVFEQKVRESWTAPLYFDKDRDHDPIGSEFPLCVFTSDQFAIGVPGAPTFKQLGELIGKVPPPPTPAFEELQGWWNQKSNHICSVCGLRPLGHPKKAGRRKVCDICEERRQDRSLEWLAGRSSTIWTDEVADENGRLALVAARFRLDKWLDDKGHIAKTLYLDYARDLHKSASFARLDRVWDTTRQFWSEAMSSIDQKLRSECSYAVGRVQIRPTRQLDLGPGHTYSAKVGTFRLSVVYEKKANIFFTSENLKRICDLRGCKVAGSEAPGCIAEWLRNSPGITIEDPDTREQIPISIADVTVDPTPYSPLILLQDEPEMTLFLAPAAFALDLAEIIRAKYAIEMSRVRNRLPLDIGIVYAPSATPLRAIVSAGRRMMDHHPQPEYVGIAGIEAEPGNRVLKLTDGSTWNIAVSAGAGQDEWYPFYEVKGAPKPVHVCDLKIGDWVCVEPSMFDFEFLDSSARRFEIAYNDKGKRATGHNRPWPLDALTEVQKIRTILANQRVATTQVKQLDGLLAARQQEWGDDWAHAKTFFIKYAIHNVEWKKGHEPANNELAALIAAGQSGLLHDTIELVFGIEKRHKDK